MSGLIFHKLFVAKENTINKKAVGEQLLSGRDDETEQHNSAEQNTDADHRIDDIAIFGTASAQRDQMTKQQVVNYQQRGQQDIDGKRQLVGKRDVKPHENKIGEDQI
ncbi:hypothetical protein [Aeromonas sp. HMWF016]|uniref:hypothetical protein n=1 Tax=Aeromonas sp. HMWF016 TaxID=2056852 RepID=UPI0015E82521|nr:hypothetical protein [Aeromonas sp. HMWF016]